jgi:hypothetical protein
MKAAAIYARVSSEQQKEENTIASQTAALIEFAREQGYGVPDEWVVEDEGFSGASLLRPGLERLRDLAAEGHIQAVLIHAPDRLSRKYASHGEPRVKGSFHLRTGTPLVVSVSECQALLHDAALLPSLINLTSGRRRYGCTNIPLAADRAWDDETILPVRQ